MIVCCGAIACRIYYIFLCFCGVNHIIAKKKKEEEEQEEEKKNRYMCNAHFQHNESHLYFNFLCHLASNMVSFCD